MAKDDAVLLEKLILILKNIKAKVLMDADEQKGQSADSLRFYKQKCEHLNRELMKMKKIETMFKRNRRETESKLKRLEFNLYFGSLSKAHLKQLFEIQTAYNQTLLNVQQAIKAKVYEDKL